MVEGSLTEDGTAGVTGAEKEYIHIQGFVQVGEVGRSTLAEQTEAVLKSTHC